MTAAEWVEVAAACARSLAEARTSVVAHERELAEAVRIALRQGASVAGVAEAVGMSRARIYQIRDGRR